MAKSSQTSNLKSGEEPGPPVSTAELSRTWDGETDVAILIKANNQRRVYEQHGLPWPPPGPGVGPSISEIVSLTPSEAEVGGEDLTMVVAGTGFTPESKIIFNGGEETTNVISGNQCSTGIKPSLVGAAIEVPVLVRSPAGDSNELIFSFVDAPAGRKAKPKETDHEKDDQDQRGAAKAKGKAHQGWDE